MKQTYEEVEMEVVFFDEEDMIVTSPDQDTPVEPY